MMILRGAPNILQLIDVMKEPNDEGAALVYEFGRSTDLDVSPGMRTSWTSGTKGVFLKALNNLNCT